MHLVRSGALPNQGWQNKKEEIKTNMFATVPESADQYSYWTQQCASSCTYAKAENHQHMSTRRRVYAAAVVSSPFESIGCQLWSEARMKEKVFFLR